MRKDIFINGVIAFFITYDDDALKLFINDEIALNIRSLKLVKVHAKIAILMLL